ncbi:class I SAM-dependent methyltransferase [Actinokineospora sp. PR83]|uniref:class I SAM-dependent methyltransferase n=1 Tax=Actinokineospora sp. PR83 TaxID=2884908 RepID=UPI001F2C70DD|nr:class I SAM-dependent methyltransferase [Actinokineospora sp. PR83]MCG8915891.1 class I SAM-dependent methyltransferase [Actinokineospora sp. PR83]
MADNAYQHFDATTVDYERAYRETALVEGVVLERMPWDIGAPQPVLVELEAAGRVSGDVLDIGAGLGDNAIFLAKQGHRVTGLDVAPTAVEKARARAAEQGVAVTFAVGNATRLDGHDGAFDTVTSSLVFHCFGPTQRREYADAVARALRPGGRLLQWCSRGDAAGPEPITEETIRTAFSGPEWTINSLRAQYLTTEVLSEPLRQDYQGKKLDTDDAGATLLPIWLLEATRA